MNVLFSGIESDMECPLTSSERPVLVLVVGKSPALFERLGCGTDDSALFSMATMLISYCYFEPQIPRPWNVFEDKSFPEVQKAIGNQ